MAVRRVLRKRSELVELPTLTMIKPRPVRGLTFEQFIAMEFKKRRDDLLPPGNFAYGHPALQFAKSDTTAITPNHIAEWYGVQGLFNHMVREIGEDKFVPPELKIYVEEELLNYCGILNPDDVRSMFEGSQDNQHHKIPIIRSSYDTASYSRRRIFQVDWKSVIEETRAAARSTYSTIDWSHWSTTRNNGRPIFLRDDPDNDQFLLPTLSASTVQMDVYIETERFDGMPHTMSRYETVPHVYCSPGWNSDTSSPILMVGLSLPFPLEFSIAGIRAGGFCIADANYFGSQRAIPAFSVNACLYAALAYVYNRRAKKDPYVQLEIEP
jgi:hypothetical protein